jgi:hypothetical protein
MNQLIDQEIAHISRVMRPSLLGDMGGPILSSEYWRKRLHALLDAPSLTKMQFRAIDSMLLQLDEYERQCPHSYATPSIEMQLEALGAQSAEPMVLHG